jgi:type II secretory ATPase GspE/PulE/Tfp pilus assembly ATPase PilB-like protein
MPYGINIICGPTGSGKSTTLQKALTALMREKKNTINVITIEDPPEYVIAGAAQLPVLNAQSDEERHEKFRQAISGGLRSDPDVVMIGEIRDRASASLAFQAAMTGHQVWASLHANDAPSCLDRLRDLGIENYKLTDETLVTGLMSQRLIRRLCDDCKVPILEVEKRGLKDVPEDLVESVRRCVGEERLASVCLANPASKGCKCRAGYTGRTVVAETLMPDRHFMELVRSDRKFDALKYWFESLEGSTLHEHGIQKMVLGQCDPRDVATTAGPLSRFDQARTEIVFGPLNTHPLAA